MDVIQAAKSLLDNLPFLEVRQPRSESVDSPCRLPWEASEPAQRPYEELFRDRILRIAEDEEAFLGVLDDGRDVDYECASAGQALQEDPSLRQLRFKLVPKYIGEERFWRLYFGEVERIKAEIMASEGSAESGFVCVPTSLAHCPAEDASRGEAGEPGQQACCSNDFGNGADSMTSCRMQCNSQASSITDAMLMSPRSPPPETPHRGGGDAAAQDLEPEFLRLVFAARSPSLLQENEESQFAKVEEDGEEVQSLESAWGASYGGWVLL